MVVYTPDSGAPLLDSMLQLCLNDAASTAQSKHWDGGGEQDPEQPTTISSIPPGRPPTNPPFQLYYCYSRLGEQSQLLTSCHMAMRRCTFSPQGLVPRRTCLGPRQGRLRLTSNVNDSPKVYQNISPPAGHSRRRSTTRAFCPLWPN